MSPRSAPAPRLRPARSAGRVRLREEMELGAAEAEPGAGEREVGRARDLLEPERVGIEAARAVEVGDDEADVLDPSRRAEP